MGRAATAGLEVFHSGGLGILFKTFLLEAPHAASTARLVTTLQASLAAYVGNNRVPAHLLPRGLVDPRLISLDPMGLFMFVALECFSFRARSCEGVGWVELVDAWRSA